MAVYLDVRYTINYNANGGANAPAATTGTEYDVELGSTFYVSLSSSKPSRSGYDFLGWSASSSATSASYGVGASFSIPATNSSYTTTLYAVWRKKTYQIKYNKGANGSGTNVADTKTYDVALTLRGAIFTRTGYTQTGWSTSDGGAKAYNLSASYTTNAAVTLYPFWTINTWTVSYNKGANGTGTNTTDTKTYGAALTLKGAIFTRTGFTQTGWSTTDGGAKVYDLSASYTTNASITLYPFWKASNSIIASLTASVPADGVTSGTVTITRYSTSYKHRVVVSLGTRTQTFNDVATTKSFTIPASWLDQIPAATSMTGTVMVGTYDGDERVGSVVSRQFTVTVPASVKPTVTISGTNQSDNSIVNNWNTLVQGYSKIRLTATAAAGNGSSISAIEFAGDGVSQSGLGTTVTSAVLQNAGAKTWTVTVTDLRGRKTSATLTRTVYAYFFPSIESLAVARSNSVGESDPASGTYITAVGTYSIASCNGKNSVSTNKIEYKRHSATAWSEGQDPALSGTPYTFGGGNVSILLEYDVRMVVSDALGNSTVFATSISSVEGVSFGLNGKCARFGGPVQYPDRFECDWPAQFDSIIDVVDRRSYSSLSETGWYRVLTYASGTISSGALIKFRVIQFGDGGAQSSNHEITLSLTTDGASFVDEKSNGSSTSVKKIRLTRSNDGPYDMYVDIYYDDYSTKSVDVYFDPYIYNPYQKRITAENLRPVAAAPVGETVIVTSDLSASIHATYLKYHDDSSAANYTIGNNNYVAVQYPQAVRGRKVVSISLVAWTSNSGAFTILPYGDNAGTNWYIIGNSGTTINGARFRYWYI